MEENNQNDSGDSKERMDPSKVLYEKLISEVYKYKLEEREMALDRYRRADEQMESAESFILMGKNAISFLKQASDSSEGIERLAKEIKSIVYKDDAPAGVAINFGDKQKQEIIDAILEDEEKKNNPDEDLTDKDNTENDYED